MNEKQQPGFLLQGSGLYSRQQHALDTRVIELTQPCEILESERDLDLRACALVARKRLSTILVVLLVVFVAVALVTIKQKPIYRAQVVLDIQKENPDIPTLQELYALETVSDAYLRTQYSILASETLARRVISELHLDQRTEFSGSRWWAWRSRSNNVPALVSGSTPEERDELQRVLENFQSRLMIDPINHSRLVAVRFDSQDPNLAARVANTLAADYVEENLQTRWTAAQSASDWLSNQLSSVKSKLERSEDELQEYARRNGLVFIQNEKGANENVANERLQQLQEELTRAQADRYAKEALYRLVVQGDYASLPGVFDNRMLQDLTERLSELKRDRAQLSANFNSDYPRVKEIQNQINDVEGSIEEERKHAADQIVNQYSAAVSREQLVRQALAEQQKQIHEIAEKSVQYNILKRETDTNRQLYEGLLQQLKATGISASLKASNIRVVDLAEPPARPVKPRILLNFALAALLGSGLGVCLAFLQERLDNTLRGADDVERLLGLSALALIPALQPTNGNGDAANRSLGKVKLPKKGSNGHQSPLNPLWHRIDAGDSQHTALIESFRSLRTSILLSTAERPPSSLLVTSTQPGEGKTTVAANLALALAQIGHRVLLVDADLRSPSLHRLFGTRETLGLVSYLTGHQEWRAVVCPSGLSHLDVLFCGPLPPNPSDLLSCQRMATLIQSARDEYQFVILDSAPMLALADSRLLAPKVSAVLLVVRNEAIPREQVLHARSDIASVGGNLIGVVLNRVDVRTHGYYYQPYSLYGSPGEPVSTEGHE